MSNSVGYRSEIDGLRAVAVIAVIGFHFLEGALPSGYLGVDVFFVISGYVITASLHRDLSATFLEFVSGFYARRVRRLLPGLLTVVLFGSIGIWLLIGPVALVALRTGISALIGLSNLYLLRQALDYWGASASVNPFTHTWSLGVEEQFYLLFPAFFWALRCRRNSPDCVMSRRGVVALVLVTLVSLLTFIIIAQKSYSWAFYGTPFRIWELGAGALLYVFEVQNVWVKARIDDLSSGRRRGGVAVAIGSATSICFVFAFQASASLGNEGLTFIVVLSTVLLIATLRSPSPVRLLLTRPSVVYLGKLSYSLYLWHWVLLVLARWSVGLTPWTIPILTVATLACSIASYELIELRLRHARLSTPNAAPILVGGLASISLGLVLYFLPPVLNTALGWSDPWAGARMLHADYPCHTPKWSKNPIADCLVPKDPSRKHIYVMGDSHSTNMIPSILEAAGSSYEVRYLGDTALLGSMLVQKRDATSPCGALDCEVDELGKRIAFFNRYLEIGDIVFFALTRDVFFDRDYEERRKREPIGWALENIRISLHLLARSIQEDHGRLYVIDSLPKVCSHQEYATGVVRRPNNPCQGSRAASLADRAPVSASYRAALKGTNAVLLDPHPYLCPTEVCQSNIDGKVLSWDGSPHFLNTFPDPLKKMFEDLFSSLHRR